MSEQPAPRLRPLRRIVSGAPGSWTPTAALSLADGVANLACGTLTLAAPSLWRALGLPTGARLPAGAAMITGGVVMTAAASNTHPPRAVVAAAVGGNAVWACLGAAAVREAARPVPKVVLAAIATYDLGMGVAKCVAAQRGVNAVDRLPS